MNEKSGPETIEDVLECLEEAGNGDDDVAVSDIVHRIGDDAFAPLMLAPALIMLSPATAIFGVATLCGVLIALIAMQIVLGRKQLWLPRFVLDRRISAARRDRIVGFLTRPARYVDTLTRARLSAVVSPPLDRAWAALCLLLALMSPVFELVPMSATIIAAAISLFALAMLAKDGLLAVLGLGVLGMAAWLVLAVAA